MVSSIGIVKKFIILGSINSNIISTKIKMSFGQETIIIIIIVGIPQSL